MSLVKSRGLRSSDSFKTKSVSKSFVYAFLLTVFLSAFSQVASAQSENTITNPASIASIFLSLLVVVGIIFALAYLMRRFNVTQAGSGQMKIVASMVAGTKERLMVIEVGEEQYLLGITSHNISHLATLPTPLTKSGSGKPDGEGGEQFKDKLIQAMAGKLSGSKPEQKP
jgi:flagellar protein FliO/FliZ